VSQFAANINKVESQKVNKTSGKNNNQMQLMYNLTETRIEEAERFF
jgi:hypothetical protein